MFQWRLAEPGFLSFPFILSGTVSSESGSKNGGVTSNKSPYKNVPSSEWHSMQVNTATAWRLAAPIGTNLIEGNSSVWSASLSQTSKPDKVQGLTSDQKAPACF